LEHETFWLEQHINANPDEEILNHFNEVKSIGVRCELTRNGQFIDASCCIKGYSD
jgi:hypothetical protein